MSRMNKKAQVTIAIILAVILILAVSIILYLRPSEIEGAERALIEVPEQARPVAVYIQDCVDMVTTPGVYLLGAQGGYVFPPNDAPETYYGNSAYGYKDGANELPSRLEMEFQLSTYMDAAITSCANFSSFRKQGFEITDAAITTTTIIGEDKVIFRINWPIKVAKGDFETTFGEFETSVPVRLGKSYSIAQSIISRQMEDPENIDMSYLSSFDMPIETAPIDTKNLMVAIIDNSTMFDGEPFAFVFINKYTLNERPVMIAADGFTVQNEQPFFYDVNATDPEGDELTFKDHSGLFDINSTTGIINFTPQIPGEYDAEIKVTDPYGNEDRKFVKFIIR